MEKILVSACLLGDRVRYDGHGSYHPSIAKLKELYEIVPFCCEVEGGLPTPRKKSEIKKDEVIREDGVRVTRQFKLGAEKALNICKYLNIKLAVLKENSPSCGVHKIHNGEFNNKLIEGHGVLTEVLHRNGITCINEDEIDAYLTELREFKESLNHPDEEFDGDNYDEHQKNNF